MMVSSTLTLIAVFLKEELQQSPLRLKPLCDYRRHT